MVGSNVKDTSNYGPFSGVFYGQGWDGSEYLLIGSQTTNYHAPLYTNRFLIGGDTYEIFSLGAGERVVGVFFEHISSADNYQSIGSLPLLIITLRITTVDSA